MSPKYEFTNETLKCDGHTLHRIKRLSDNKLGDWIEKESNLSQEGDCWVDGEAKVYGDAQVYNAKVYGTAHIYDNARVHCWAEVCDEDVYGNSDVTGR